MFSSIVFNILLLILYKYDVTYLIRGGRGTPAKYWILMPKQLVWFNRNAWYLVSNDVELLCSSWRCSCSIRTITNETFLSKRWSLNAQIVLVSSTCEQKLAKGKPIPSLSNRWPLFRRWFVFIIHWRWHLAHALREKKYLWQQLFYWNDILNSLEIIMWKHKFHHLKEMFLGTDLHQFTSLLTICATIQTLHY